MPLPSDIWEKRTDADNLLDRARELPEESAQGADIGELNSDVLDLDVAAVSAVGVDTVDEVVAFDGGSSSSEEDRELSRRF